jgi:hypothetical protein
MTTEPFTIDDLRQVLRAAAGGRIERERGIELADSTITDAETPRALITCVNEQLGAAAVA